MAYKFTNLTAYFAISKVIELGFASGDYFSYLHSALLRAIPFRIASYAVKLAYNNFPISH